MKKKSDFSVYLSGTHDLSNSIYLNAWICPASKERIVLWLCLIVKTRSRKSEAKKGHKGHQSWDNVHDQNWPQSMRLELVKWD